MAKISMPAMKAYLADRQQRKPLKKIPLSAKSNLVLYLSELGFQKRFTSSALVAFRGWTPESGWQATLFFPETIGPSKDYSIYQLPDPDYGLHTICATFHQIGIQSYFCSPIIEESDNPNSIQWKAVQLGLPVQQEYQSFPENIHGFQERFHRYNFSRYHLDVFAIPQISLPEEFSKEHLRVTFQNKFMSEMSDVDGIFWGEQYTYPIEIKEKTSAKDRKVGDYFALDVGSFVKLAFYAAKGGSLRSLFIVREIDDVSSRNLIKWWFITFEHLAQFASWVPGAGGTSMIGRGSTVIKIPKAEFQELNAETIAGL